MTHNTREVEEIIKEFFDLHFRQTEDGKSVYLCMTSTADDVGDWLAETVHHQLQKAREEERRQTLKDVNDYLILNYKMTVEKVDELLLTLQ